MGFAEDIKKITRDANDVNLQQNKLMEKREKWLKSRVEYIVETVKKDIVCAARQGKNGLCYVPKVPTNSLTQCGDVSFSNYKDKIRHFIHNGNTNYYLKQSEIYDMDHWNNYNCDDLNKYISQEDQPEVAERVAAELRKEGFLQCRVLFKECYYEEGWWIFKSKNYLGHNELYVEISW